MASLVLRTCVWTAVLTGCITTAVAQHPHDRSGFVTGVGIGRGETELTLGGVTAESDNFPDRGRVEGYSAIASIGYGFGNHFVVTLENRQWFDEQGVQGLEGVAEGDWKARVNTQHLSLNLMWAPFRHESMAGGLYFTGGVGWANSRFTVLEPVPVEEQEYGETYHEYLKIDEDGLATALGVGYEIRILPPVAVGLSVSVNYLDTGAYLFDESVFVPMAWTLNWYW